MQNFTDNERISDTIKHSRVLRSYNEKKSFKINEKRFTEQIFNDAIKEKILTIRLKKSRKAEIEIKINNKKLCGIEPHLETELKNSTVSTRKKVKRQLKNR